MSGKILHFYKILVQDLKGEKCCESIVLIGRVGIMNILTPSEYEVFAVRTISSHFVEHTAAHLNNMLLFSGNCCTFNWIRKNKRCSECD